MTHPISHETRPRLVLVIEDDAAIGSALQDILQDEGFEVVWHEHGLAGLAAARALQPWAVLLDLGLPDVDGREILRALRADPATVRMRVVIVSANTGTLTAHERAQSDAVIPKPFDLVALLEAIGPAEA